MSEHTRLYLAFMREAMHELTFVPTEVHRLLFKHLGITLEEQMQIRALLFADAREHFAMSPDYEKMNDLLIDLEARAQS